MKSKATWLIILLLTVGSIKLQAQQSNGKMDSLTLTKVLQSYKLNRFYHGTLGEVLQQLKGETGIQFEGNPKLLSNTRIEDRPFNQSLEDVLNRWCKRLQLRWQLDASNQRILILRRGDTPESSDPRNVAKYRGAPTANNFTLSGVIKDGNNGESLPFANIQVKKSSLGANSNADGYFTLLKVPTDTSTLIISYLGYKTQELQLNPTLSKDNLIIELSPEGSLQLDEVTITAESEALMRPNESGSIVQLTPKQLAKLPNVGERDIMRSLQLLPGVSAANESTSGLFVRGGTPDQNLILYDGFTVYHVDHLYGFFSAFNYNALKDLQLYKGGFESRFGGRLSSVTEITGKEGNAKRFSGGGDLSLLSANAYLEGPIGKTLTFLATGRRSWKGPLYNQIFNRFKEEEEGPGPGRRLGGGGGPFGGSGGPSFNSTVSSYFYDLNGKLTWKASKSDIFSLSFFNGTDYLDNSTSINFGGLFGGNQDGGISNTDLTNYGNIGTSLKWSRRFSPKLYANTLLSFSNYYSDRDRTNQGTITNSDGEEREIRNGLIETNNVKDWSLRSDFTYDLNERNTLAFGLALTYYDIAYSFSQNDTVSVLGRNDQGVLGAVYLQDKISLLDKKLDVTPGIRTSYFEPTTKVYIEPRLNATYRLTSRVRLNAAWGKYYQFANRVVREDLLSGSRDFWILSNDQNIPVSSAWHYILGAAFETPKYLFSAETYYKKLDGISEYSLRYSLRPGQISYEENFYSGQGFSRGIELLAQKKSGKYTGWVSYTLGQARNQIDIYGDDYFPANQDVTQEFKAVGIRKIGRWDLSATWIYATGRPYTSPDGGYSITLLDGTEEDYITTSAKNGNRLPDYHRLDIGITCNFNPRNDGSERGSLGLSLFNVYGRKNVWYKEYQIEDGSVYEVDKNYLGFTPNLTFTLKF